MNTESLHPHDTASCYLQQKALNYNLEFTVFIKDNFIMIMCYNDFYLQCITLIVTRYTNRH